MVTLAEAGDSTVHLMNAHMHTLIATHHMGEFRQARQHANAVIGLASRGDQSVRSLTALDPGGGVVGGIEPEPVDHG